MWNIQWKDNEPVNVSSFQELNSILDDLQKSFIHEEPHLVQIRAEDGKVLLVGLGREYSVLTYLPKERWPSKSSRGGFFKDSETVMFLMGTYPCEMPSSYTIPVALAREAVALFCSSGDLLESVNWVDD